MTHEEDIAKVAELMNGVKICTFTTVNEQDQLVSRPMAVQQVEFDGDVWFFTYEDSQKNDQVKANSAVNVAFQNNDSWLSLSGKAEIVHDHNKAEELWNPSLKAWFPEGIDQPGLSLIKIHADSAEYWDSKNNKVTKLLKMAKAAATGTQPDVSDNQTVQL